MNLLRQIHALEQFHPPFPFYCDLCERRYPDEMPNLAIVAARAVDGTDCHLCLAHAESDRAGELDFWIVQPGNSTSDNCVFDQ